MNQPKDKAVGFMLDLIKENSSDDDFQQLCSVLNDRGCHLVYHILQNGPGRDN